MNNNGSNNKKERVLLNKKQILQKNEITYSESE